MDSAPLVKAHDHARAAASATRQGGDVTVAITEHAHAAGEFANAAKDTSSAEALRTLRLLEAHHRRLAELLKLPPDVTTQHADDEDEKAMTEKDGESRSTAQKGDATSTRVAHMPGLNQNISTQREMSSSIASNLASARGIRSKYRVHPLSPSISNDNAPGNVDAHPRRDGSKTKMQSIIDHQSGKPSWVPPSAPPNRNHGTSSKPSSPRIDDEQGAGDGDSGYAAFYNAFGSIMNKISAPLAFAGLPLIQEESISSETQPATDTDAGTKSKSHAAGSPTIPNRQEPDLSKIYSKATMRALAREGHNPHESFYVVPTTGHTMSYANILNYAEKEKRRLVVPGARENSGGSKEDDDDDFVDARESPSSLSHLSPGAQRRVGKGKTERELNNTIEELYTENQSLKDMLDKLSKRLQTFEASAQSSAMALAESYRLMRPSSPTMNKHDDNSKHKTTDTEEQLAAVTRQMEKLEKDNRKMQKTLDKYREKWEVLKAGAKARRDGQKGMENIEEGI